MRLRHGGRATPHSVSVRAPAHVGWDRGRASNAGDRRSYSCSMSERSSQPATLIRKNPDYAILRREDREMPGTGYRHRAGWAVNLIRSGRTIQSSFHDRTYGSKEVALHVARAYRDAVLEVVPPLTNIEVRTLVRKNRDPRSMPGVHFQPACANRPDYWIARIEVPTDMRVPGYVENPGPSRAKRPRRQITRSFSVKRYGDDGARRMAEKERVRMLAALENPDAPVLGSERARQLHRAIQRDAVMSAT